MDIQVPHAALNNANYLVSTRKSTCIIKPKPKSLNVHSSQNWLAPCMFRQVTLNLIMFYIIEHFQLGTHISMKQPILHKACSHKLIKETCKKTRVRCMTPWRHQANKKCGKTINHIVALQRKQNNNRVKSIFHL